MPWWGAIAGCGAMVGCNCDVLHFDVRVCLPLLDTGSYPVSIILKTQKLIDAIWGLCWNSFLFFSVGSHFRSGSWQCMHAAMGKNVGTPCISINNMQ